MSALAAAAAGGLALIVAGILLTSDAATVGGIVLGSAILAVSAVAMLDEYRDRS